MVCTTTIIIIVRMETMILYSSCIPTSHRCTDADTGTALSAVQLGVAVSGPRCLGRRCQAANLTGTTAERGAPLLQQNATFKFALTLRPLVYRQFVIPPVP